MGIIIAILMVLSMHGTPVAVHAVSDAQYDWNVVQYVPQGATGTANLCSVMVTRLTGMPDAVQGGWTIDKDCDS